MNETDQNHQNPNPNTPNSNNKKSLMEESANLLENDEEELSDELKSIIEELEADGEFSKEIQALVDSMQEGSIDLAALQSKFILLIKASLLKLNKQKSRAIDHKLKTSEQDIFDQLAILSRHIMMQKSQIAKDASEGLSASKDKYENFTDASIKSTKQILKRFAIYEVYKILNPRRIAGETKRENFVHNYIAGGMRRAMRYDLSEVKKASPQTLRALEKERMNVRRSGQISR